MKNKQWHGIGVILVLIGFAIVCGGSGTTTTTNENPELLENLSKLKVTSCSCRRYKGQYGIGSYFACSISLANGSDKRFKNPRVKWLMLSKSEDELESETETIMDFVEPKKSLSYTKKEIVDPGMISDDMNQISKYRCEILGADLAPES